MALDKFTQITKSGIVTTINFECHHLYSTGIATFSSGNISAVDGTFTGDVSIGGTLTYQDVTNIDSVGLVTARLGLNVTAGVSTFAAAIDANGGVDISGGSGLVASTAKISDLTDNRVVIGGSAGELEDSANLTFDGSNLGVGSKVTVTNANADADNPNSLGAEINAAWIRLGDVTAAKSFSNGLGIKFYDQGTAHWSAGTIGNKFYISNTSTDGNKLFPSSRTDAITCDTTGKVGIGTVTPGNTVHIGGTQGVGVRWHNYTSGNSAYHTLESGDKFQSNVGGSGEHGWVSAGGTKMTLTNAGRLGIGTAIPVGKFESYNTGLSTPTKTWGGGNPGQRLVNEGSELKIGLTAYSPYAYFLQANTSSGTDRQLTLNPMGGSVGIGLTNAQTDAGLVARYPNTHAPSLTWNTAGGHTLRNEGSELVFGLSNSSPHPYFLQARTSGNAAKQLVLNPLGGNVGIHETSPEEILDLGEANQQNLKVGQRGYLGQAYSTSATILGHSVKAKTTGTTAGGMEVTETNSGGGAPSAIRQESGTIQFHTASSGTSGAAFDIERLRIASDGHVRIQKTGANAKLLISRNESVGTDNTETGVIDFANNTAHTVNARIMAKTSGTGNVGGQLLVETRDPSNSTLAERLRITSKGDVGINTTGVSYGDHIYLGIRGNSTSRGGVVHVGNSDHSVTGQFSVYNSKVWVHSGTSHPLVFGTGGANEHATLTTNGYFNVPNQPAFFARGNLTFTDWNSYEYISWGSENFDNSGSWDGTKFTCPVGAAGDYLFQVELLSPAAADNGNNNYILYALFKGTSGQNLWRQDWGSATNYNASFSGMVIQLAEGDEVRVALHKSYGRPYASGYNAFTGCKLN